ncbi:hypothetical protein [Nostoc sp. TCL240-02]|nr:hypothetical protein [Nostoc sp. TCL240-02]
MKAEVTQVAPETEYASHRFKCNPRPAFSAFGRAIAFTPNALRLLCKKEY